MAPPREKYPLLKGPEGQKRMLTKAFRTFIHNRKRWRLTRVYWFLWRDAARDAPVNCSFCKSSGLFTYDFQPKPGLEGVPELQPALSGRSPIQ